MSDVRVNRPEFEGHLNGMRAQGGHVPFRFRVDADAGGVASSYDVVSEMFAALNRIGAAIQMYREMLMHDIDVSLSACDELERIDLAAANRVSGQGGRQVFGVPAGVMGAR